MAEICLTLIKWFNLLSGIFSSSLGQLQWATQELCLLMIWTYWPLKLWHVSVNRGCLLMLRGCLEVGSQRVSAVVTGRPSPMGTGSAVKATSVPLHSACCALTPRLVTTRQANSSQTQGAFFEIQLTWALSKLDCFGCSCHLPRWLVTSLETQPLPPPPRRSALLKVPRGERR